MMTKQELVAFYAERIALELAARANDRLSITNEATIVWLQRQLTEMLEPPNANRLSHQEIEEIFKKSVKEPGINDALALLRLSQGM